jgi:AcrR family transcriptional regulator
MANLENATRDLRLVHPAAERGSIEQAPLKGKRAVTQHRLMNACAAIIVRAGFRAVSMTAIAEEAGITRQNVYRYFANADEAVTATLARAGREVLEAQFMIYREEGEPKDLIVMAVMTSLRLISMNVLLVKALSSGGNPRTLFNSALDADTTERSARELARIGGRVGWNHEDCCEVHEILVRCINSFLVMPPKTQSEAAIRDGLYRRLIPALGL